jgi:membrane protease YdiL (CAAX protease family)
VRVDNLTAAASAAAWPTAVAAVVVIAAGAILASPQPDLQRAAVNLVYYVLWGFAQQYALQGFVLLRFVDAGLGRLAPVAAASLFALVHAPNPGLMLMTFAGGWMWATLFRREPNLLVLALSHAILAVVADAMLPPDVTGGYRLGPRYLRWAEAVN